jgi:hypothetical protein
VLYKLLAIIVSQIVLFYWFGGIMTNVSKDRISTHIYGEAHPLIGAPCLFEGKPAIPYGSFTRRDGEISKSDDGVRLTILYYDPQSSFEGSSVFVKALSGVLPDDKRLIVLDPKDFRYQIVQHQILSWLADNRCGTFQCVQRNDKRNEPPDPDDLLNP